MELLKKNTSHKDGNTGKYFPLQRQFRDALVENQCQVGRNLKSEKNPQNKKTPELIKVKTTKTKSRSEQNT